MMKFKSKKVVLIPVIVILLFSFICSAYAIMGKKTIEVMYRDIKIFINSELKIPNEEPFISKGTTFVPLRFIAESFDKVVSWNNESNVIDIYDKLKEKDPEPNPSDEWVKVYEWTGGSSFNDSAYKQETSDTFHLTSDVWKIEYLVDHSIKIGRSESSYWWAITLISKTGGSDKNLFLTPVYKNGVSQGEVIYNEGKNDFQLDLVYYHDVIETKYAFIIWEKKTSP